MEVIISSDKNTIKINRGTCRTCRFWLPNCDKTARKTYDAVTPRGQDMWSCTSESANETASIDPLSTLATFGCIFYEADAKHAQAVGRLTRPSKK